MAINRVVLVGRLTRDPEQVSFPSGGKVARFGFAVSNRRKNSQTGQYEDEPMFIDCEAFGRADSTGAAGVILQFCHKGSLIGLEGKLHLDQWDDKNTGAKRQKHKIIVDSIQLLDPKQQESRQPEAKPEPPAPPPPQDDENIPF